MFSWFDASLSALLIVILSYRNFHFFIGEFIKTFLYGFWVSYHG